MKYQELNREELISRIDELESELIDSNKIIDKYSNAQFPDKNIVEGELQNSVEMLKQSDRVFNLSLDMFCIAGFDGYFKYLNPAWERTLGWTIEELLTKPWSEFVHPEDREKTENVKSVMIDGKEIYQFENRYICKDGSEKWLSWNSQPFPNEDIMIGAVRDITESKEIGLELLKAKERAEEINANITAILEGTNNSIWAFDRNYNILYINPIFQSEFLYSFGVKLEPGMNIVNALPKEIQPQWKPRYDRVLANEQFTIEDAVPTENGTIYIEVTFNPILKNGKVVGGSCFGNNITERKKAEQDLKYSEERFKAFMNYFPGATFIKNNKNLLLYCNDNFAKMLNTSADKISGTYINEDVSPELEKIYEQENNEVFDKVKSLKSESEYQNNDEKSYWLTYKFPIEIDTELLLGAISFDITERKKVENALKDQKQYLEKLNNSLESVVVTVDIENRKIEYVNNRVKAVFGYNPDECIGNTTRFLYPNKEAFLDYGKQMQQAIQNNEEFLRIENTLKRKNGQLFTTDITTSFLSKTKVVAVITDITERKKAELELIKAKERAEESEILKNKLVANIADVIVIIDHEGNNRYKSPNVEKLFGWKPEELIGNIAFDNVHPDDIEKARFFIDSLLSEPNKTGSTEVRYRNKDGRYVWIKFTGSNLLHDPIINGILGNYHDISESKNAETELLKAKERAEENQEKLSLIVNKSPFPVVLADTKDEEIIYWSESAKELTGYLPETVSDWYKLAYPDEEYRKQTVERWKPFLIKARESNEAINTGEYHITCKNGSRKEVEIYVQFIPGNLVVTLNDITERKKNQQDLISSKEKAEESEKQLRLIADNFVNGMIYQVAMLDENRRQFNYISNNVKELYGSTIEEVKKDADLIYGKLHPADVEMFIEKEKEALKNMSVFEAEARAIKPNGDIRWAYFISKPRIINGVACWDGIEIDITERKNIELELIKAKEKAEESEVQMKKAQKTAMVGNWVWHIRENRLWWSDEMYRIFEIDKHTFTGELDKIIEKAIHPDDREKVNNSNESVINHNKPIPVEFRIIGTEGSIKYVLGIADEITMDENGKSKHLSGIIKDITSYKLIQQDLISAKEKAEESDRLKSAFLANMSHEIRTPMNGILGFTNLLKDPDLTGEEQSSFIEIIEKSGDRMLTTINDIIDISKIEAGQVDISTSDINFNKILVELFDFFLPEANKKNLELSLSKSLPDDKAVFKSDKEKLNSIITNFIKNAIKFTKEGSIKIGYTINAKDKHNELEFYVKDTGIGILKERQEAIFNRFEQADIEDRSVFEGSGLGLAISKAYVEMLGGKIWVESEPGVGSKFCFSMPYISAENNSENNKNEITLDSTSVSDEIKVLIVDDDAYAVKYLSTILKEKELLIARTGIEAVEMCRDNPDLDLILMDIKIPGINGYEATKQIREFNKDVFILAQTAFAQSGDREKALEAGCNEYISKPIDREKLLEIISKI